MIIKLISNSPSISVIEKEKQLELCKLLYKIQSTGILVCNLYCLGKENIFNENENKNDWINAINKMKRINVSNKKEINDTLDEINNNLSVAFCSMNQLEKYLSNNYILDNSMKGALMAYNYIRKKNAKFEADKFLINPDIKICQKIWGLTETKESKKLIKIVLPHIEYRQTFYISRNHNDIINFETIDELTNIIDDNDFQIKLGKGVNSNKSINNMINEEQNKNIIFENENISLFESSDRFKTKKELKSTNKDIKKLNYIKIILIHNSFIKTSLHEKKISFFCCNCDTQIQKNNTKNSIIVHVHGGGFITLSPLSHENYTRKTVNKTGIPLLSIDYRLSPEYSFPSALDDVYQAYTWLLENGEKDLNIKINNIILLGDSAGGNLILSLIYILLIKKMKLPNLVILAYPAVKMNIIPLSLSYLNSLYDPLLDYNLLSFCLKSYLGDYKNDKNPFLSPLYMKTEIIKYLPKLKIYGGTGDPLRDDYVEYFHKCNKAGVDCQLIEFKYFPHGFLNYDYSFIMPQASKCTEMICEDINNFMDSILS
jgi:hormone-sensitive lipase